MKTISIKDILLFTGILALVLLLGSCTEEVDETYSTQYLGLVVEGSITTDTTVHQVILSKTGDPLNTQAELFVSNAIVTISCGTDTFKLTENAKGVYETQPNVYGVPGKTYTLNISNVDVNNDGVLETYTANSLLKNENPIDSISFFLQNEGSDFKGCAINLYSQDIGGGRDYYLIKVSQGGDMLTDSIHEYQIANNSGFEGKYYDGITVYFLDYNKADEILADGDLVTLELDGITQDYYNFIDAYKKEYFPKNPIFSGPSANVPSNILPSDKAVGFFAAYSVQRQSAIYRVK